jgi:hypothetical protein
LSRMCAGFPVPGMTQVTAGCASTNFNKICAQLVQPSSLAQAGSVRRLSLRNRPPPPNGRAVGQRRGRSQHS